MPTRLPLDKLLAVLVAGVGIALGDARTGVVAGLLAYFVAKSVTSVRHSI